MKIDDSLLEYDANNQTLYAKGEWNLKNLSQLKNLFKKISPPSTGKLIINGKNITKMDSAGAWLLLNWQKKWQESGLEIESQHFSKRTQTLLNLISDRLLKKTILPLEKKPNFLAVLGKTAVIQFIDVTRFFSFVGKTSIEALRLLLNLGNFRFKALINIIHRSGYDALPIIALLSLMIGVVITYQMGLQLRNYGANVYIVDLLGLSILREFGPLLTAIMVAGRTGSSYTAQLGIMKITQEVDALNTMGVTSGELLVIPRMLGLLIALPLLTMWSDIFGVVGGMLMANNMLGISWYDFLHRFPQVISLKALLIGLGKAPIFALVIASVGCYQGMSVTGSADSLGKNTTRSVVWSIFLIIVADAIFSIIFSKLKL